MKNTLTALLCVLIYWPLLALAASAENTSGNPAQQLQTLYQERVEILTTDSKTYLEAEITSVNNKKDAKAQTSEVISYLWLGDTANNKNRNLLRKHLWKNTSIPKRFNSWLSKEELKPYLVNENTVTYPEFHPFAEVICGSLDIEDHDVDYCIKHSDFNAYKKRLDRGTDKSILYQSENYIVYMQLVRLLHLDEYTQPIDDDEYKVNLENLDALTGIAKISEIKKIVKLKEYKTFHDEFIFKTIKLHNDYLPDHDYILRDDFIALLSCQVFERQQCEGAQKRLDFITSKEYVLNQLLNTINICLGDNTCDPDNLIKLFDSASHTFPPLTYMKPEIIDGKVIALTPRENDWITDGFAKLGQTAKDFSKNIAQVKQLDNAIFWNQISNIEEDDLKLPNTSISNKIKPTISIGETINRSPPQDEKTNISIINVDSFGRIFSSKVADELISQQHILADEALCKTEDNPLCITITNNTSWLLALSTNEITNLLKLKGGVTERVPETEITIKSIKNCPVDKGTRLNSCTSDNTPPHKHIDISIKINGIEVNSPALPTTWNVSAPWPSWFAQHKDINNNTFLYILFTLFILLFTGRCFSYSGFKKWPYQSVNQPKRKKLIAQVALSLAPLITLVLLSQPPKAEVVENWGRKIDIYLPLNKAMANQKELITTIALKITKKYTENHTELIESTDIGKDKLSELTPEGLVKIIQNSIMTLFVSKQLSPIENTPAPTFKVIPYGWDNIGIKPCNGTTYYNSFADAAKCYNQVIASKWEPTTPAIFTDNIDTFNSTDSIVFYDGDPGTLNFDKDLFLQPRSNKMHKVKSIFLLTPTRTTNDDLSLSNRLKGVVNKSDISCIVLPKAEGFNKDFHCLTPQTKEKEEVQVNDFMTKNETFFSCLSLDTTINKSCNNIGINESNKYDIDKKRELLFKNIGLDPSNVPDKLSNTLVNHTKAVNNESTSSNSLGRTQLKVPSHQLRSFIILIILAIFLGMMFYYHRNGFDKAPKTELISSIIPTIIVLIVSFIILYLLNSSYYSNGVKSLLTASFVLISVFICLLLSWLAHWIFAWLLQKFSKHDFIAINKNSAASIWNKKSNRSRVAAFTSYFKSQAVMSPGTPKWLIVPMWILVLLMKNISLILLFFAIVLWASTPTNMYPNNNSLLFNYKASLILAGCLWALGVLTFYLRKK